jgi:hypothetical protein
VRCLCPALRALVCVVLSGGRAVQVASTHVLLVYMWERLLCCLCSCVMDCAQHLWEEDRGKRAYSACCPAAVLLTCMHLQLGRHH